jgi:hypothetical protein
LLPRGLLNQLTTPRGQDAAKSENAGGTTPSSLA